MANSAKKRLVIANWKMYVERPEAAKKFAAALKRHAKKLSGVEVALCPAFPFIPVLAPLLKGSGVRLGAQTVSSRGDAPHTGEVSAAMLKASGAALVLVGHSERRAAGEGLAVVRSQLEHAAREGLAVVLCVGETERDPSGAHFTAVTEQLSSALKDCTVPVGKLVVAYEPVWAIGKTAAEAMEPAELTEMVIFIRKTLVDILGRDEALRIPVLYGGSVEPDNAAALLADGGVSGFLVGHASADIDTFLTILTACSK